MVQDILRYGFFLLCMKVVERQLVSEHLPTILDRGYSALMDGHKVEDVARLYSLAARVGAVELLRTAFRDYIKTTGLKMVKDEEKVHHVWVALGVDSTESLPMSC